MMLVRALVSSLAAGVGAAGPLARSSAAEHCLTSKDHDVSGGNLGWQPGNISDCCEGCASFTCTAALHCSSGKQPTVCKAAVWFQYCPDGSGGGCCYYKAADSETPKLGATAIVPGKHPPPPPPPPVPVPPVKPGCASWLDEPKMHNATTFRNVLAFGAKGDGVTDDTDAINRALSEGRDVAAKLTTQPAVVYLPPGKYAVSKTLQMAFYTFIHGNPLCPPTVLWLGQGEVIGGPPSCNGCDHDGAFFYGVSAVNVDTTKSGNTGAVAVHWAVSQGTYLRNMQLDVGDGRSGIFGENGSGGLITDVVISGGDYGLQFGNQQWTFRNVAISGARKAAIFIFWNWVFSFIGLSISDCAVGIVWPHGAASLVLLDSEFKNVDVAIQEDDPGNGFFLFDRVVTDNVTTMIAPCPTTGSDSNRAPQVNSTPAQPMFVSWRQGPALKDGVPLPGNRGELPGRPPRPNVPLPSIPRPFPGAGDIKPVSVMDFGAKADGVTDDSTALQKAINANSEVLLPHGKYLLAKTVILAQNTSLYGEAYSVLIASGSNPTWASNATSTESMPGGSMLVAPPGSAVKLVDLTFMADGDVPGCLLLDWQAAPNESGAWDIMFRIESIVWGMLRISETPGTPAGGYFENMWLWVADHIFDTGAGINVTSPRGFLFDHASGSTSLYGVAAEHSSEYQYFLNGTSNVTMVLTQSETPYWQDPPKALALKIHNSQNILSYGGAYECWFHGVEHSLLEVTSSLETFLYLPNVAKSALLLSGDKTIKASDPTYNVSGHFTQSFVADIP